MSLMKTGAPETGRRFAVMEQNRKYPFSWELLGDLALGRPNLGRKHVSKSTG